MLKPPETTPNLIEAEPGLSTGGDYFSQLDPGFGSFGHDPNLMIFSEVWNEVDLVHPGAPSINILSPDQKFPT